MEAKETMSKHFQNEKTKKKKTAGNRKGFYFLLFFAAVLLVFTANLYLSGCRDGSTSSPHSSIAVYEGAKTCEQCHPGVIADVRASTHYTFLSKLPDNYVYDNASMSTPVTATHSGKMTKI